jgi:hypothetical protein
MDLKLFSAVIVACMLVAAIIPYVSDIFKGKTKPHLYTWLVWMVTGAIGTGALIYGGGGYPVYTMGIGTALCGIVVFLSFKYGTRNITLSDTLALIVCAVAVFIWLGLNNPLWSAILGVTIDIVAYWPTLRKTFVEPWSESLSSWLLWILTPAFSVLALDAYNIFTIVNYLPIFFVNLVFLALFLVRRKIIPKPA